MNQTALVVTQSKERYYNIITVIDLTLLHEETGRTSCAQSCSQHKEANVHVCIYYSTKKLMCMYVYTTLCTIYHGQI